MQSIKLVLALEQDTLRSIEVDLISLKSSSRQTNDLKSVYFTELTISFLRCIESLCYLGDCQSSPTIIAGKNSFKIEWLLDHSLFNILNSISTVYNLVDVDSRGTIKFSDFSNFCLRMGRMLLKPSVKQYESRYFQDNSYLSESFPMLRISFIPSLSLLFCFELESCNARVFG